MEFNGDHVDAGGGPGLGALADEGRDCPGGPGLHGRGRGRLVPAGRDIEADRGADAGGRQRGGRRGLLRVAGPAFGLGERRDSRKRRGERGCALRVHPVQRGVSAGHPDSVPAKRAGGRWNGDRHSGCRHAQPRGLLAGRSREQVHDQRADRPNLDDGHPLPRQLSPDRQRARRLRGQCECQCGRCGERRAGNGEAASERDDPEGRERVGGRVFLLQRSGTRHADVHGDVIEAERRWSQRRRQRGDV